MKINPQIKLASVSRENLPDWAYNFIAVGKSFSYDGADIVENKLHHDVDAAITDFMLRTDDDCAGCILYFEHNGYWWRMELSANPDTLSFYDNKKLEQSK